VLGAGVIDPPRRLRANALVSGLDGLVDVVDELPVTAPSVGAMV